MSQTAPNGTRGDVGGLPAPSVISLLEQRSIGMLQRKKKNINSHLSKPRLDPGCTMPSGEQLLRAERHSFHSAEIRWNPGEAHGVVLAVVRAGCVALDAYPGAVPAQRLDGLVLFGEPRRYGGTHIRAKAVDMAFDRCLVLLLLYVPRRKPPKYQRNAGMLIMLKAGSRRRTWQSSAGSAPLADSCQAAWS